MAAQQPKNRVEAPPVLVFNGSQLREFISDEQGLDAFCETRFAELDEDKSGFLSLAEIRPSVAALGHAAGMPPPRTKEDFDKLIADCFKQMDEDHSGSISPGEFKHFLRASVSRIAESLEARPVAVLVFDGSAIRSILREDNSDAFDAIADDKFNELDEGGEGAISKEKVLDIFGQWGDAFGAPFSACCCGIDMELHLAYVLEEVEEELGQLDLGNDSGRQGDKGHQQGKGGKGDLVVRDRFKQLARRMLDALQRSLAEDPVFVAVREPNQ
eukprot:jgi/Mesvir1/17469/Mv08745-RA.1